MSHGHAAFLADALWKLNPDSTSMATSREGVSDVEGILPKIEIGMG